MISYPKQVEFYHEFVTLMRASCYNLDYAVKLATLIASGEIIDDIIESPDVELHHAWQEVQDDAVDKPTIMMFVSHGFEALAPHLRDPQNRELLATLIEISGASSDRELFAHVPNVRLLGKNDDGPAVITLVVHSMSSFNSWFTDPEATSIRRVHGSFTPGWGEDERGDTSTDDKTFVVGDSFRFAVQCRDPKVGISGSRCSNCDGTVAFCEELCRQCRMPIIGPGITPDIEDWKVLSAKEKAAIAKQLFDSHNHGRMGYANVDLIPLTETELKQIEAGPKYSPKAFANVHGIPIHDLRRHLTRLATSET